MRLRTLAEGRKTGSETVGNVFRGRECCGMKGSAFQVADGHITSCKPCNSDSNQALHCVTIALAFLSSVLGLRSA